MKDLKNQNWEESYQRKENFIFYPQVEVVRFINRFVKKKIGIDQFDNILHTENESIIALDFGCGIGRTTLLFEEFKIEAYGVDISYNAIEMARKLAAHHFPFKLELQDRFQQLNNDIIPFPDNYFDIAVSDSVLDSMYFKIAKNIIIELDRTVKRYLFISLISDPKNHSMDGKEEIVKTDHEKGTIQSYYTLNKINELIINTRWKIKTITLIKETQLTRNFEGARYYIVLEK